MVHIESSRKAVLAEQFQQPYFIQLIDFLKKEKTAGQTLYPPGSQIFNAFALTPFEQVQVVILGQDPYHGPGQAMGLCFSVASGVPTPPSLKNIFKEIDSDLGIIAPKHGDLTKRAEQGVFLLNAILTVRARQAASHRKKGREQFTDAVIQTLSDQRDGLVFLLRGAFAKSKASLIDKNKHSILTASHPSPLSAHKGRFGCKHFSRTNELLEAYGKEAVDWRL